MTARARRLLVIGGAVVLLLLLGRSLAVLLTDRWWAATISDGARDVVTRWTLFGWALDALTILLASLWFAANGLMVVRGVASVTIARPVGDDSVPEPVPPRLLGWWAVGLGVVLGAITGGGARGWRAPLALAWEGVHFGAVEPLSGADLGTFVATLPAWELFRDFAMLLVLLALALTCALYAVTGGLRREPGGLAVHPHTRRHLGVLLALLAMVIAAEALLHPSVEVARMVEPLPLVAARVRGIAAQAMFGAAMAVALLSLSWALRGRHSLIVASWIVLALALAVVRLLVPAITAPTAPVENADAEIRQATARAWGLAVVPGVPAFDSVPVVTGRWDAATWQRAVEGQGGLLAAATPGVGASGGVLVPEWHLASISPNTEPRLLEVFTLRDEKAPLTAGSATRRRVDARLAPSQPRWLSTATGVSTDGVLRRIVLAWGRQAAGLLRPSRTGSVDWHLDPTARAAALMPMVSWLPAELILVAGEPRWLVQGVVPIEHFPLAARGRWVGRDVAGVAPAFLAVMEPTSGRVRVYRDPSADSLAAAWSRILAPLVEPDSALPVELRTSLIYSRQLLEAQLRVLEGPAWQLGRRPGRRLADGPAEPVVPVWTATDGPAWQAIFEDPARLTVSTLATAARRDGRLRVALQRLDGQGGPENGRELERRWNRLPALTRWRDSARAARDSVLAGTVRWHVGPAGLVAWQPVVAISRFGKVTAIAVAVSAGDRVAVAREPAEAWAAIWAGDSGLSAVPTPGVDPERWRKAREWMARADSALARGDLTAFGRAFEALRGLLQEPPLK